MHDEKQTELQQLLECGAYHFPARVNPMNKKLLLCLMLLLPVSLHANDLIVASGETYTITENQRELQLEKLILGDKATIKFAPGISYWDVRAKHVEIGRDVVIDGRGVDGAAGMSAVAVTDRAENCTKGKRGGDGEAGARGGNGVDIQMNIVVAKLGSMKVMVDGGAGGTGGNGAQGQQGGLAKSCDPTDGGDGGNAGIGGVGGNGGKLTVSLNATAQAKSQSLMALSHQIEASAAGGRAGIGGKAGVGGNGSEAQFINQKTLTGDKQWVSGGKKGKQGLESEKGKDGIEGRVFIGGGELSVTPIKEAPSATPVEKPISLEASDQQQKELEELKTQMRLMQQRLESMEKQNKKSGD